MNNIIAELHKTRDELLAFCRSSGKYMLGYYLGKTLVNDIYQESVQFIDDLSICSYYIGMYQESLQLTTYLLEKRELNKLLRTRIQNNRHFCVDFVKDKYISYPSEIVEMLTKKKQSNKTIIFTITTCKRFDLFTSTMNSFLNCCLDLNLIDEWICIDDNSNETDRESMKKL